MMELVDIADLESVAEKRESSSLSIRTIYKNAEMMKFGKHRRLRTSRLRSYGFDSRFPHQKCEYDGIGRHSRFKICG